MEEKIVKCSACGESLDDVAGKDLLPYLDGVAHKKCAEAVIKYNELEKSKIHIITKKVTGRPFNEFNDTIVPTPEQMEWMRNIVDNREIIVAPVEPIHHRLPSTLQRGVIEARYYIVHDSHRYLRLPVIGHIQLRSIVSERRGRLARYSLDGIIAGDYNTYDILRNFMRNDPMTQLNILTPHQEAIFFPINNFNFSFRGGERPMTGFEMSMIAHWNKKYDY